MAATHLSTEIQELLESVGVDITRAGDREITGRCPVHERVTGHADRSPSWSINIQTGLWICFSCGARGTLSSLLAELSGDSGLSAQSFLIQSGLNRLVDNFDKDNKPQYTEAPAVRLDDYYRFVRVSDSRCESRNLNADATWRYGVRWDPEDKAWVVPIVSPMGKLQGWQAKKVGWFRNRPDGVEKGLTLFGVERFRHRVAVLVESPLDVVRLASTSVDAQGLATFGAQVSSEQGRLVAHLCDTVIIAMDNDKAGLESSKRLYATLTPPRHGIKWWNYTGVSAKDIGDMTDEEIVRGFETATVVPPWIR
jgi:hypothetical protein